MKVLYYLLFVVFLISNLTYAQESRLYEFLKSIPGAEVRKVDSSAWVEYYVLMLPQPLDHKNPDGSKFNQRIFVGHRGYDRPIVMETEGYGAGWMNGYVIGEPARLLNANQLYIEHRFFGKSVPAGLDWKYLTAEQDAGDYHAIRQLFGKIYTGKWIASGVSKGGQSATEYKVYYPDDVDVTIPYVAPINYKRLDKRIDKHFNYVGTKECRQKLYQIQMSLLKNKKELLPVYNEACRQQGYAFTKLDSETAFDYSVLEMPFSFWQYTADCNILPDPETKDIEKLSNFLIQIVNPFWFTEAAEPFTAATYQFYTQLGYYEYDERPFNKYLKHKDYPNSAFVPNGVDIIWDMSYIKKLKKFIRQKPQRMIFIYGECDPWGATAAKIKPGSGSLKVVMKNGTHGANISSLSKSQKEEVYQVLEEWLKIDLPEVN
jgi:hypothetical protein